MIDQSIDRSYNHTATSLAHVPFLWTIEMHRTKVLRNPLHYQKLSISFDYFPPPPVEILNKIDYEIKLHLVDLQTSLSVLFFTLRVLLRPRGLPQNVTEDRFHVKVPTASLGCHFPSCPAGGILEKPFAKEPPELRKIDRLQSSSRVEAITALRAGRRMRRL